MSKYLALEETFLFKTKKNYYCFKKFNKYYAIIIAIIPLIIGIIKFKLADIIIYIFCAICIYIPYFIEKHFNIIILEEFKFITTFHVGLHTILGKTLDFYNVYPLFDDILHVLGGGWLFLLLLPIFLTIEMNYSIHSDKIIKMKSSILAISFTNTIGVLWEITEFIGDFIFAGTPGYRLAQEGSLTDTMFDLIENNIGAIVLCFVFWKILNYQNKQGRNLKDIIKNLMV